MTSTLWFWIAVAILLLIIIWFVKRFLGRIIILCIIFVGCYFILKWISPAIADSILTWSKGIPAKTTNYVNHYILNKDIEIPVPTIDAVDDIVDFENEDEESLEIEEFVEDQNGMKDPLKDSEVVEEENHSWFARLFKKHKDGENINVESKDNEENMVETTENEDMNKNEGKNTTGGVIPGSKLQEKYIKQEKHINLTGESLTGDNLDAESEEVYYVKTNPKPANQKTPTNKTGDRKVRSNLSADDIREANAIFGK